MGAKFVIWATVVTIVLVVAAVIALSQFDWKRRPGFFYLYACGWMFGLVLLVLYLGQQPPLPKSSWTFSFQEVLPLWVPWAGALGGSFVSLVGVAGHTRDWRPSLAYWHLARPVLGAFSGTIGVLIVVLVIKSVQPTTIVDKASEVPPLYDNAGIATLSVIAFVIGYREATFRSLVERVVDVILAPGATGVAAGAGVGTVEKSLEFAVKGTAEDTKDLHLFNGSADSFGLAASSLVITPSDQGFAATLENEEPLTANAGRKISVTWTPTAAGVTNRAELTISLAGYVVVVPLKGVSS